MPQQQSSCHETGIEPIAVQVPEALRISGFSRTWLYSRGRQHGIVFRKAERRTLIEVESLRAVLRALPQA